MRYRKEVMRNDSHDPARPGHGHRRLHLLPAHGTPVLAPARVHPSGIPARGHLGRPGNSEPPERAFPWEPQVNAPEYGTSLSVIYARNDHARHVLAGFAAAMPAAGEIWDQV